jgi:DNA modification methylase
MRQNLEQLAKLPDACVDLVYIDPSFNSNRNYGQRPEWHSLWGETKEKRAFADRHENIKAYIDYATDALQEIESFFKRSHKVIVVLTVKEILDEQIAKKLV